MSSNLKNLQELIECIPELEYVCEIGHYSLAYCRNLHILQTSLDKFTQSTGISYATQKRPTLFGQRDIPDNYKICWEEHCNQDQKQIIPFIGHPFILLPKRWSRDCNNGPDRNTFNKKKFKIAQDLKVNADHSQATTVQREPVFRGVKKGCPAKIFIKEAIVFTQFKGDQTMHHLEQVDIACQIRTLISDYKSTNGDLPGERRLYILFPANSVHEFHNVCSYSSLTNPIDKRVADRIRKVLLQGVTRRSEMRTHITMFVQDNFPDVPRTNTAYYPSDRSLSSQMYRGLLLNRYSHMDQERVLAMVSNWREEFPNDYFFFRPQTKSYSDEHDYDGDPSNEDDVIFTMPHLYKSQDDSTLLFIHQSETQLHILKRYPNMVLMDATYKTCKLALPLFFLVVKTNVGYSVIAEFVIQREDTDSIAEALGYLKSSWDAHGIKISSFMVDKQAAEQAALRAVFLKSEIYLCDFHRLQCWDRFLKTGKNGLIRDKEKAMKLLRKVAESTDNEEYKLHLRNLHQSSVWNRSSKLRDYYAREWAGIEEMWVYYYRLGRQLYDNTNNGVESKNKVFKYNFLNCCRNLLLSRLLGLLVEIFVPLQCARYTADNARGNTDIIDMYDESIPDFLKDRPPWFIRHCNRNIIAARNWSKPEIVLEGPGQFKVRSFNSDVYYDIDVDAFNPRCSCMAWLKSELPCKHIFAVLQHTHLEWNDFPLSFRNHPLFNLDKEILVLCDPSYSPPAIFHTFETTIQTEVLAFEPNSSEAVDVRNTDNDQSSILPVQEPSQEEIDRKTINSLCKKVREQCSLISEVTWLAENAESLKSASECLSTVYNKIYETCQTHNGIPELKKSDKTFKTLKNNKPIRPGIHGKRRIVPISKPKSIKKRKNTIPKTGITYATLEEMVGELPTSTPPNLVNFPPTEIFTRRKDDLDNLLDTCESVYVSPEVLKGLSKGFDDTDDVLSPFADINAFKELPTIEVDASVYSSLGSTDTCTTSSTETCSPGNGKTMTRRCRRILTSSIYYVVAKISRYVLLDVDLLPLQGEHWQTDQLMMAYLHLLAERFSKPQFEIFMVDFDILRKIFQGDFMRDGRPLLSSAQASKVRTARLLIGAHLKDGNHWTLVMLDTFSGTFLYLDPLQNNELSIGEDYKDSMEDWVLSIKNFDKTIKHAAPLVLRIVKHAPQTDGRNCGIWTLWFAKRILQGRHIKAADIGKEGALIAADVIDASDCLSDLCAKCGHLLNLTTQMHHLKVCYGNCKPRKSFHSKCVPQKYRSAINFKCEICDPSTTDDNCYKCRLRAQDHESIETCSNGNFTGCTRFVHTDCLAAGTDSYRCGLCTLNINQ